MKKTVYSPQLNEVFKVVDENNSAYITEEGAYLSKKMAKKWEELEYGEQLNLKNKLVLKLTGTYESKIDWVNGHWFITEQFQEKEARKLRDKIELENFVWGFDEELFRSDINKTVNQDFYD